jgi:subtilisin family serine protease
MQLAATAAAPAATFPVERWAWVRVASPKLDAVRAMPPGEARRAAAVSTMRSATGSGSASVRDALAGAMRSRGALGSVDIAEQLWLDGSAVVHVRGDAGHVGAIEEELAKVGARLVDHDDLPGGRPQAALAEAGRSGVEAAAADRQWFADELGFARAWSHGLTGEGVRLAVVDSGIDYGHPQLQHALARGMRIDPFAEVAPVSGHGTYVAGIVAGSETGLAPGVDLTSSRTYRTGFADVGSENEPSRIAQRVNGVRALQEALAPADGRRGADILVTSWGILDKPGVPSTDYDAAMATIAAAGGIVVAAAGNDGSPDGRSTIATPAQLDDVIAVGGVKRDLQWHHQASAGPSPRTGRPKPDLAAPVVDIRSTQAGGGMTDTSGNPDGGFGGTSAAAPIVASALALLTQAVHDRGFASPDIDEVRSVLPLITRDVDAPGPDPRTGVGVIDLARIEQAASAIVAGRRVA